MRRDIANARMGQLVGADWRTYSLRAVRIDVTCFSAPFDQAVARPRGTR